MRVVLLGLVVSLVAGFVAGGGVRSLTKLRMRWPAVGLVGTALLVVHAVAQRWEQPPSFAGPWLVIAGTAGLAVAAARNAAAYPGLAVAAFGLGLNVAVMAANGAMPVDLDASLEAGTGVGAASFREGAALEPVDEGTKLAFLARRIPVDIVSETLSWGDVAVALGFAGFVYQGMVEGDEDEAPEPELDPGGPEPAREPVRGMVWFGSSDPIALPELVGPTPASTVLELPDSEVGDVFWTEWTRQQARAQLRRRYLIDLTAAPEPAGSTDRLGADR